MGFFSLHVFLLFTWNIKLQIHFTSWKKTQKDTPLLWIYDLASSPSDLSENTLRSELCCHKLAQQTQSPWYNPCTFIKLQQLYEFCYHTNWHNKHRSPVTLVSLDSYPYNNSKLAPSLPYPGGHVSVLVQVQVLFLCCLSPFCFFFCENPWWHCFSFVKFDIVCWISQGKNIDSALSLLDSSTTVENTQIKVTSKPRCVWISAP